MLKLRYAALVLTLLIAATTNPGSASVIFQSIPDLSVAPNGAACSNCSLFTQTPLQVLDDLSISHPATISNIAVDILSSGSVLIGYDYHFPNYAEVRIWKVSISTSDGQTVTTLGPEIFDETLNFASISNNPSTDVSLVTVAPVGLALGAGTYAISFYNVNDLVLAWYAGGSGLAAQLGANDLPSQWTSPSGVSDGFALYGSVVPEPGTWLLMLLGFVSVGYEGFRRRGRNHRLCVY